MTSNDPIFTPELVKIIKIFGLASILMVLALSFFNSKRANNTGEDHTFRMSDSARLYFLNLKAIEYNREVRSDAGMTLFRHQDLKAFDNSPFVNMILILNPVQDEAYLYLEPINLEWPIEIEVQNESVSQKFILDDGNKFQHWENIQKLIPFVESGSQFFIFDQGQKIPLWEKEVEKDGLKRILEDYFRILES
jgi:hypothetical protein